MLVSFVFSVDQNARMNQGQVRGGRPVGSVSGGSGVVVDYNTGSRFSTTSRPREFDRQGRAFQGGSRGNQSSRQVVERNVRSKGRSAYDHRGRSDSVARDCDLDEVMFDLENQHNRADALRGVSTSRPGRISKKPKRTSTAGTRSSVKMATMQGQLDAMSCKLDKFLGSVASKEASIEATHVGGGEHSDVLLDLADENESNADVSESSQVGGFVVCFVFLVL